MDCNNPPTIERLIRQFTAFDRDTGCSIVFIGSTDPITDELDCDTAKHSLLTLLAMSLFESDSVIAADIDPIVSGDIVPLGCDDPMGLETLFRMVMLIDGDRTKIKAVQTSEVVAVCATCDTPKVQTPLLTKVLGTFVRVNGEIRVRVEGVDGTYPAIANVTCGSDANAWALLNGALSYDAGTGTWYWNVYFI